MRTPVCLLGVAASLLLQVAGAADVSPAELAQCAGISAADARLGCYDALAHRTANGAAALTAPPSHAVTSTPASRSQPAAAAPVAPSPAPAPIANDPQNFGLSLSQIQKTDSKAPAGPKSIGAHIAALSTGLTGHARIVLDNQQTWDVLDDDGQLSVGNEVTIRKAALGSFLMSAPSHHTYRVHRVN